MQRYLPADYCDVYACKVEGAVREITPDDIMVAFWTHRGGWVGALFRLRNFLVRFMGLEGSGSMNVGDFEAAIRGGGSYRFASIPAKSPDETVMLLSDKHLDAWLSIRVTGANTGTETRRQTIFVITVVRFKQRLGRIYFFVIRPFHALIVKSLLRRAITKVS